MMRRRSVLAAALAVAYATCPLVEPYPDGPEPAAPLWLDLLGVASVVTIVAAVAAVARGARSAGRATLLAGAGMVAMTVTCPVSGHHVTGWWTWWQAAMSAFVLLAGLALAVRPPRATPVPPPLVPPRPREHVAAGPARRPERPKPVRPATPRAATRPARSPEHQDRRQRAPVP